MNRQGWAYKKITPGTKFGKLTVIYQEDERKNGSIRWLCHCDCGGKKIGIGSNLRAGQLKSCGCLQRGNSNRLPKGDDFFVKTKLCIICDNIPSHIPNEQKERFMRRIIDAIL